jgi:hypothetical protein
MATKTTQISIEAKIALFDYFIGSDWPLNNPLPRGRELVDILGTILKRVGPDPNNDLGGLSHAQIARQLRNYKKKFCDNKSSSECDRSDMEVMMIMKQHSYSLFILAL